jgi:hypothetical protein
LEEDDGFAKSSICKLYKTILENNKNLEKVKIFN